MDVSKVLLVLLVLFITYTSKVKTESLIMTTFSMLGGAFFLDAMSDQNIILQLSTFLNLAAIGIFSGLLIKNGSVRYVQNKWLYRFYLIFIAIQLIHLLFDTTSTNSLTSRPEVFSVVNPTGLVTIFIFLFCFNSKNFLTYTSSKRFINLIIISNTVFFLLVFAVQLGIIEGNTSKLREDLGGIGLRNTSTNETALLAICLLAYLFYYLKNISNNKGIMVRSVVINIAMGIYIVVISRSRIGLVGLVVILTGYFIGKLKRNPVVTLLVTFLVIAALSPLILLVGDILHKRAQNDEVETGFSTFSDSLGFTLSGRTLVWEAYISEFMDFVKNNFGCLFVGDGFADLQLMYKRSFLGSIGYSMENVNFFPIHSDAVLVFITSGIAGLFIWIRLIINIIRDARVKHQFLVVACAWILLSYFLFDMLSYSLFSSFLIGLGIAHKQEIYKPAHETV